MKGHGPTLVTGDESGDLCPPWADAGSACLARRSDVVLHGLDIVRQVDHPARRVHDRGEAGGDLGLDLDGLLDGRGELHR
ncbi:hypothetical protein SDC9_103882 [bioreactor metagenome]|uniref:Uncharacterized protein n=1 Tax=bioreactor metagenome TaxID=1076179 RepID=A0A645B5Q3_9ZZZZ